MRNSDQLVSAANKTVDSAQLRSLLGEAIELARFYESKVVFADRRLQQAQEQIKRQTQMIENLEKTLWGKKQ